MKKTYKRRTLVDGKYQIRQAAAVVAANTIAMLFIAGLLSWFYLIGMENAPVVVNHNNALPLFVLICILIVVGLTTWYSFRRSRSVAGMMACMHKLLDNARQGTFPDRTPEFRKSDYYRQIAGPLNGCLEQLRAVDKLVHRIDGENMSPETIKKALEEIRNV